MAAVLTQLQIPGLSGKRLAELEAVARSRGMTPQRYAKTLIEDGLAIDREAQNKTFDEILEPLRSSVGKIDEAELDELVDRARTRHHESTTRKRR